MILALGADIKNRILVSRGKKLVFGPVIGDLGEVNNFALFKEQVDRTLKKAKTGTIAYDLHPHYFSSLYAKGLSPTAYNLLPVQHHHAHIASVICEHELKNKVIGIAFDGTGYGADGKSWGGEFLIVGKSGCERRGNFQYRKMAGGDKVAREPWRMLLGILGRRAFPVLKQVPEKDKTLVMAMLAKNVNSPQSSSVGRLFDAAAALLGLCAYASTEAEGPMKLELLCDEKIGERYEFDIVREGGRVSIDTDPVFSAMLKDVKKKKSLSLVATKFHNTICESAVSLVKIIKKESGLADVALSGGVFQNRFLKERLIRSLRNAGFRVYANEKFPANDLNIAVGQYYVSCGSGKN